MINSPAAHGGRLLPMGWVYWIVCNIDGQVHLTSRYHTQTSVEYNVDTSQLGVIHGWTYGRTDGFVGNIYGFCQYFDSWMVSVIMDRLWMGRMGPYERMAKLRVIGTGWWVAPPLIPPLIKADRPHPRYYPHTPTNYRHTDKLPRLAMIPIALCCTRQSRAIRAQTRQQTDGRTDGRTDATKYIISLASRSIITASWFMNIDCWKEIS